ncbi:coagulation factor IX-like [Danaus plexippus]|uniref:coagulation factor IX-like n=1 Tax=Danaus plexippus TaxID=13037 RepID=UPI002AB1C4C8|nr:coagulation factor IX-like [Danaus plexippus]
MLMCICIVILNIFFINCNNDTENDRGELTVNDIASTLVSLLGVDAESKRIKDLNEKLKKIDSFVVDKDKYAELLLNETMTTNLNETNFFNALNESDHFRFLIEKEPKNLYLKLKEKMNRDDILRIVSKAHLKSSKSGRKMMVNINPDYNEKDEIIEEVVDEMIAKMPTDQHKFKFRKDDNIYWDPQGELEDLNDYHKHNGRRIYKGERTTIRYYPFMVSVHVMGRFWCGGSIYWHDLVLTSAACLQLMHNNRFFRENPGVLKIRLGSNHSRIGGENVEALEVYFHPGYNPRTLRHNIAIIRLRRHLFFSYHRIPKLIDISHTEIGISPTSEVLVLGWGVTKMSQKLAYEPVYLNRKFLPIYPNVFCKDVYGKKFISETMFCAGTLTTGEGACDHDAGGPAVIAGKLVGIISFGPSVCGYPNAPTVFTLVGAYSDWIESVNESMPGYYRGKKRTTTLKPITFAEYKIKKLYKDIADLNSDKPATATTEAKIELLRQKNKLMHDDSDYGFSIL